MGQSEDRNEGKNLKRGRNRKLRNRHAELELYEKDA